MPSKLVKEWLVCGGVEYCPHKEDKDCKYSTPTYIIYVVNVPLHTIDGLDTYIWRKCRLTGNTVRLVRGSTTSLLEEIFER